MAGRPLYGSPPGRYHDQQSEPENLFSHNNDAGNQPCLFRDIVVVSQITPRFDRQRCISMHRKCLIFILLIILFPSSLWGIPPSSIETKEIIVLFEESLEGAAKKVAVSYPALKKDLEERLKLSLDFRPVVLLLDKRETFQEKSGSKLIMAFAIPSQRLIVMDYSIIRAKPYLLETTLKHELCHLLLHRHIESFNLPKWLDEGVSQWVSEGMAEIIMNRDRFILGRAVLSGKYFRIRDISRRFPEDEISLLTAYEESKDLIEYTGREFGEEGIIDILEYLKAGNSPDEAVFKSLSVSLEALEELWLEDLKKRTTWFTYLTVHLYQILFSLGALLAVAGFVRTMIRMKNYRDDDMDIDEQ